MDEKFPDTFNAERPQAFSDSSHLAKATQAAHRGKKEMMMMTMMATCKVRNTAEHNLNGFGVPQHEESPVKMLTQTTAAKQNGVQLLLSPRYIMHG